jgi:tetratricopeptide (TPR) repeat protein
MPVTTDSDLAREYYETAILAFDQIKLSMAWENFEMAVKEDPNFFMAHFWMYFLSSKESKQVGEQVLISEAPLNEAEKLIRTAFKYLMEGQDEKVVEYLQQAIDLYPSDPQLHKILYILQYQYLRDVEGSIKSMEKAIEACPDFPVVYNQMGYALMDLDKYEEAEKAFDKYIRLAPNQANPYDSKGDYFMNTEQYEKAYESYTKAFELDSGFTISQKKAAKAKQMLEKAEI